MFRIASTSGTTLCLVVSEVFDGRREQFGLRHCGSVLRSGGKGNEKSHPDPLRCGCPEATHPPLQVWWLEVLIEEGRRPGQGRPLPTGSRLLRAGLPRRKGEKALTLAPPAAGSGRPTPFTHPRYWVGFVLIGDPD